MPLDFSKLAPVRAAKRPIDPIELFQSLKVSDRAINDLWLAQGDALRDWNLNREAHDVAVVLNTGAGKTLVGLLAAQSLVNETNGHVLYGCGSIQLVEQTAAKAQGYGLALTTYFQGKFSNDLYVSGMAPCITTYHALFNGKSRFRRDVPTAVVFDDAHTAEHLTRDQFTLRIRRDQLTQLFGQITALFAGYHQRTGKGIGYSETCRGKDNSTTWFVPPFVLRANFGELQRQLVDAELNNQNETKFAWEHLRDQIDLCCVFISANEVSFTPPIIPTATLPYFTKGVRRLYLSATLTAKDAFLRTFGRVPDPIIAPATTAGECERLIIIPRCNSKGVNDIDIAREIITNKKALILVPSHRQSEKWSEVVGKQQGDDVTSQVELFKKADPPAKLLLVGRYDGVDLPGETCRTMVVDELPSGVGPLERYLWEKLGQKRFLRSTVASRVVQSFGRISRGMSDHGVIILTGESLVGWLLIPANRNAVPRFLRQQLDLGIAISRQVNTVSELIATADQCLSRDQGWLAYYKNSMEETSGLAEAAEDKDALAIAKTEVDFINAFWSRDYEGAARLLHGELNNTFEMSVNTGAWHALWLGYCYEIMGDDSNANEMYHRARGATKNIPPSDLQTSTLDSVDVPPQVIEVARYLYNGKDIDRSSFGNINVDLAALGGEGTSAQTEEAIRKLGEFLGLDSSRPEKEVGTGPDVLWDAPGGPALNQELKTDKARSSKYQKRDVGQLYDHFQWVRGNSTSTNIFSTFVGPVLPPTDDANPGPEITVIELSEYRDLAERLRAALEDICVKAVPVILRQTVFEVFQERGLLWPNLYDSMRKHVLREIKNDSAATD